METKKKKNDSTEYNLLICFLKANKKVVKSVWENIYACMNSVPQN